MSARKASYPERECDFQWERPHGKFTGPHRCIKDAQHVEDITDDDHQCCCGATDWPGKDAV